MNETRSSRKLEIATNVAVLFVAVLVGLLALKQFGGPRASQPQIKIGERIALKGVNWGHRNLVLALSSACHFCSESAPFYKRLARQIQQQSDVQIMAILPQPVEAGRAYLDGLGISIDDIRQVRFSDVPIPGTPTLLLVNPKGEVEKAWIGKLTPDVESEVLKEFGCKESC